MALQAISTMLFLLVGRGWTLWRKRRLNIIWQLKHRCKCASCKLYIQFPDGQHWKKATHLESLTNSWIQHGPVHPAIHPDSANKEILLLHLLTQKTTDWWESELETNFTGPDKCERDTYIFKDMQICNAHHHSHTVIIPLREYVCRVKEKSDTKVTSSYLDAKNNFLN